MVTSNFHYKARNRTRAGAWTTCSKTMMPSGWVHLGEVSFFTWTKTPSSCCSQADSQPFCPVPCYHILCRTGKQCSGLDWFSTCFDLWTLQICMKRSIPELSLLTIGPLLVTLQGPLTPQTPRTPWITDWSKNTVDLYCLQWEEFLWVTYWNLGLPQSCVTLQDTYSIQPGRILPWYVSGKMTIFFNWSFK